MAGRHRHRPGWAPAAADSKKTVDVVVYEKLFLASASASEVELVEPMMADLRRRVGLSVEYMRYGSYYERELR